MPRFLVLGALVCALAFPALADGPPPYKVGRAIVGTDQLIVSHAGLTTDGRIVLKSEYRAPLGYGKWRVEKTLSTLVLPGQTGIFLAPNHRVFYVRVDEIKTDGSVSASFTSRPPSVYRASTTRPAAKG